MTYACNHDGSFTINLPTERDAMWFNRLILVSTTRGSCKDGGVGRATRFDFFLLLSMTQETRPRRLSLFSSLKFPRSYHHHSLHSRLHSQSPIHFYIFIEFHLIDLMALNRAITENSNSHFILIQYAELTLVDGGDSQIVEKRIESHKFTFNYRLTRCCQTAA